MVSTSKLFCIIVTILTHIVTNSAIYHEILEPKPTSPSPGLEPHVISHANISQVYQNQVNDTTEFLYEYEYADDEIDPGGALRVFVESEESEQEFPVLVVVRHEKGVLSWQLPLMVQSDDARNEISEYRAVNRTLCPLDHYQGASSSSVSAKKAKFATRTKRKTSLQKTKHRLTVSISSATTKATHFKLRVYVEELFKVGMENRTTFSVSPSAPQYFEFHFPAGVDTAIVAINSTDSLCMTVSVQNISCPVYDLDRNVQFQGLWQTVDTKTGLSVRRDMFPQGLHLVFVVKPDDMDCTHMTGIVPKGNKDPRIKNVTFSISKKITKQEYLAATFGAFGMFVGAYLVVILVSCIMCVRTRGIPEERSLFENPSIISPPEGTSRRYGSMSRSRDVRHRGSPPDPKTLEDSSLPGPSNSGSINDVDNIAVIEGTVTGVRNDMSDDSSIDETDIDMLVDVDFEKDIFRTKTFLYISDLARKSPRVLAKKSQLYQWNLLTMAIFYGLPVFQLCMTYQQVLNQTGNQDLCYYNFLCSHPLGLLSDFNHVYSNIGYVMLGGLFIVLTWRRDLMYARVVRDYPQIDRMYGVPQHPGMFYAMGLALMMEGLMSGCYHICPNHSNFQFDTAFMYTIAILCMLKIYQSRHPDINANAYTSFGVLAFVIFVSVIGVVTPLTAGGLIIFWTLFSVFHVVSCIILSIQIYYMGRWKVDSGLCRRVWLLCSNDCQALFSGAWRALKPTYPDRAILLLIFNLANWGLAAYGVAVLAQKQSDFAGYLLAVFIMNLLLYTLFYIVMKLRHGERLTGQPVTYMLLAAVSWSGALYFFINKRTSWILPPAESKHYNQDCTIFHFYDNHDIWHFLSATSLFLNFMMLLTLDDDLYEKPREKIPVF